MGAPRHAIDLFALGIKLAQTRAAMGDPPMDFWTTPMNVHKDWQRGMSYDNMHVKYGPWGKCECDACDRGRVWERAEEELP